MDRFDSKCMFMSLMFQNQLLQIKECFLVICFLSNLNLKRIETRNSAIQTEECSQVCYFTKCNTFLLETYNIYITGWKIL